MKSCYSKITSTYGNKQNSGCTDKDGDLYFHRPFSEVLWFICLGSIFKASTYIFLALSSNLNQNAET